MTGSTAPGPNPLPTPPPTPPPTPTPAPTPAKEVGRFGEGKYHPGRSILVSAAAAATAASGYYFLFEIHKNQDLKDAISKFRTAMNNLQLSLEDSNTSSETKNFIRIHINYLKFFVGYDFSDLTYSERTAELGSVRKILDAIGNQKLAGKLDSEYKMMLADFNSVRGASDAASRMKIGREALMVGAGAGVATGLAAYYTESVSEGLGKIFFSEPGEAEPPCYPYSCD